MPKTISIINQRGDSGKTYVATQLALAISKQNKRTLVIDLNHNGDIFKKYVSNDCTFFSNHIFTGKINFKPTNISANLDLIPSKGEL